MKRFLMAAILSFGALSVQAEAVQQSPPQNEPASKTVAPPQTGAAIRQQEPAKKGVEVLGEEIGPEEGEFVEKIIEEKEELPLFGYDLFRIDTFTLTPGPVDPETYLISPGDKLMLRVWGELSLEFELEVTPNLYVTIPEVGRVYLSGQTLKQVETTVRREMANVYASFIDPNNPANSTARIELTATQIQEVRFLVQGEVESPGSYTLHPSLGNLIYALAKGGGVKDTGSLRQIRVRRGNQSFTVDFYDFLLKGEMKQEQLQVQHNDTVFVPLKTKEVSIRGEVRRPARYELLKEEYFRDLIEMAGGLMPSASTEKALILRTELNEGLKTIDVNLKELQAFNLQVLLKDQDVVNIFSTYLLRIDYVSVQGEGIALPGDYQLREGMHVKDLLDEAGGLTGQAYLARADLIRTRADMTRYYQSLNLNKIVEEDPEHNLKLENLDQLIVYTVREIQGEDRFITLSGHVKNPGRFELYQDMRLYDLLFAKGGFQDKEFLKKAYTPRGDILRISEDGTTRKLIRFNLEKLLERDPSENFLLQAEDEIKIYSVEELVASEHYVTLSGHVKRPGKYRLYEAMALLDLLDVYGGFQDREFRKETFLERADLIRWVRRGHELERKLIRLDLGALLLGDDSENLPLQANDEIVIYAAKDFMVQRTVSIDGFVKKPGVYEYAENMTLGDLLVQAGGFLDGAYARAEISRLDLDANPSIKKDIIQVDISEDFFRSDESTGIPLKANDQVFVRKHPEYEKQAVVEIRGEVQFPGHYVLKSGEEQVSELIQRAGGLKESAYAPAARLMRLDKVEELEEGELQVKEEEKKSERSPVEEESERYRVIFSLEKALEPAATEQDLFLRHGDLLEIPRFENVVQVRGEVLNEATLVCVPGKDVDYYISQAGGCLPEADKKGITVTYPDGRVLKTSGFLWFGKRKIESMSVIMVPPKRHRF
ncbi:SLBB domain-containing protein [Acidobacteria bacterium AH-259-A15]|nr:SLBB domain-containing protein [Acidobacteria bacterium AH-259-A15]